MAALTVTPRDPGARTSCMRALLSPLCRRTANTASTEAVASQPRRLAQIVMAAAVIAVSAVACGSPQVLPDEPFRSVVPANAQLTDELVDDGSSIIVDGESSVLRTFVPIAPADAVAVSASLVETGESLGWVFADRSPFLAVGTKEIDGRLWMVSLVVRDDGVQQLFAGR